MLSTRCQSRTPAAVVALSRFHPSLRSRSPPRRLSPISRCCSRPPPATPTAARRAGLGLNGDGNYVNVGVATAFVPSPMPELRGGAPGDGQCRALLLRLADADGRTCAESPCHDAHLGTATAQPDPGRADHGRIAGRPRAWDAAREGPVRARITNRCTGRSCPSRKQVRAACEGVTLLHEHSTSGRFVRAVEGDPNLLLIAVATTPSAGDMCRQAHTRCPRLA